MKPARRDQRILWRGAALLTAGLWTGVAQAQSANWLANPGTADFNTGTNWSTGTVPTGLARFNASTRTSLTLSANTTLSGLTFNAGAPSYTIDPLGRRLTLTGQGIVNNSGNTVTFGPTTAGQLIFSNTSSAGGGALVNNNIFFTFTNSSTAESANIVTRNGGVTTFQGNSTAAGATLTVLGDINNGSQLNFTGNATAANATLVLQGQTAVTDPAFQVGSSQITGTSTLGNAQVNVNFGGYLQIVGTGTAGQSTITVNNGGFAEFRQGASGGQARLIGNAGGNIDISALTTLGTTLGSLEGSGTFYLGSKNLTVGGNGLSTSFGGSLVDNGFFGAIAPGGSLTKVGPGTLTLTGVNTYTGLTTVNGGALNVNGSLVSFVTVNNGGTIMGNGTIGGLAVLGGGVAAPGNSIGTLNVAGPVSFSAGSVYQVEANAAGQSDKIVAAGKATLSGGTVQVLASPGAYAPSTTYTILTAGSVAGTFANVTSNFAFLTPTLLYDSKNVYLVLVLTNAGPEPGPNPGPGPSPAPSAVSFCSVAVSANQCNTGNAVQAGGAGSSLYNAVIAQSVAGAQQAFDALSGELHGSVRTSLLDDSRYLRLAVLGRLRQAAPAASSSPAAALSYAGPTLVAAVEPGAAMPPLYSAWGQAFGAWGQFESDGNAASMTRSLGGFVAGADFRFADDWLAGIAAGYSHSRIDVGARNSAADIDSAHVAAYLGGSLAAVNLRAGAAYAWHTIGTSRAVMFPGYFDTGHASYGGATAQAFGEVGYGLAAGPVAVEPFAGLAWANATTSSFSESGGAAALAGGGSSLDIGYSNVGVRAAARYGVGEDIILMPRASIAWQHAVGTVTPNAALAFQSTGQGFTIGGVPAAQDSALVEAGLDLRLSAQATVGIGYVGQFAGNVGDHAITGRLRWAF
jgi:outer membrane autotransporter protein